MTTELSGGTSWERAGNGQPWFRGAWETPTRASECFLNLNGGHPRKVLASVGVRVTVGFAT
jgi:hypothetical protein